MRDKNGNRAIVIGDTTTHGGRVASASSEFHGGYERYARSGDRVECPMCGGSYQIERGSPDSFGREPEFAVEGQRTSCGARLVSRGSLGLVRREDGSIDSIFTDFRAKEICGYINKYNSRVDTSGPGGVFSNSGGCALTNRSHLGPGAASDKDVGEKNNFDEQFCVVDDKTGKVIPDLKYIIRRKNDATEICSGTTDIAGLTERVFSEQEENIEIYTFDVQYGTEEVYIDANYTNAVKNSVHTVRLKRGRIFFSICYDVPDKAFERAGRGYRSRSMREHNGYRPEAGDIWLNFIIKKESQFVAAWNEIAMAQKRWNMEIAEGRILTHGSIGAESGLDFIKEEEFGEVVGLTLTYNEVRGLYPLQWSKISSLYLHSCRSGVKDDTGLSLAEVFSENQKASYIYGQSGYTFFSLEENNWVDSAGYTGTNLYLWSYQRPRNAQFISPYLNFNNAWMLPQIINNAK